jgi:hypothetical protein
MKYLYRTLLDSQYISNKSIWTVKCILRQVFTLCMPHVNANLCTLCWTVLLVYVLHGLNSTDDFFLWSLSYISVVWSKPNTLLSAYSDSNIFSATHIGLYNCIMHSQKDSSQYFTMFTMSLWLILASDSTDYPGFESRWGRDILHHSERPQGLPTLLHNWNWVSFLVVKWTECGAHHIPLLEPQWSMGRAIPAPPHCACLACYRTAFTFIYNHYHDHCQVCQDRCY